MSMNTLDGTCPPHQKRLSELLQEQQEPFPNALEIAYQKTNLSLESSVLCWLGAGAWRKLRLQLDRRRRRRLLRSVIRTLHLLHPPRASGSSFSQGYGEEFSNVIVENDDKQEHLSPVSVLDRISDEVSPDHDDRDETKAEERSRSSDYDHLQSDQTALFAEEEKNYLQTYSEVKKRTREEEESSALDRVVKDIGLEIADEFLEDLFEELVLGLNYSPTCL